MIELIEIAPDLAEKIIKEPELWGRVSEDGQDDKTFKIEDRPEYLWLGIFNGTMLIGCFFFHQENQSTVVIHIQIIEEFREHFAFDAGKAAIEWFSKSKFKKMVTQVPVIYQDVYHYAKKFGFLDEGINRASYSKNGRLHNQLRLGITKDEAKLWLQQQ